MTANAQGVSGTFSLTNIAGLPSSVTANRRHATIRADQHRFRDPAPGDRQGFERRPAQRCHREFLGPRFQCATATLSSPTATTNAQGIASVTATANANTGTYSVTASVGGLERDVLADEFRSPPAQHYRDWRNSPEHHSRQQAFGTGASGAFQR